MSKYRFSLKIEPLTPLFFGDRRSLDPYQFVSSTYIPNIYTISGVLLGLIASIGDGNYRKVEELVLNGDIIIKGPYLTIEYGDGIKYFIQSPKNVIQGVKYKLKMDRGDDYGWVDLMGINSPRILIKAGFKPPEMRGTPFIEIFFDKLSGNWRLNIGSYGYLTAIYSDRTSFTMNRSLRVVSQPSLYFRSMVEEYRFNSRIYGISKKIYFSCDFTVPDEYVDELTKLNGKIVRFGGEGGLAKVRIERREAPILTASVDKVKSDNTYLAVSHIPVIEVEGGLEIVGYGKAEWIFGDVELLGGWLIRVRRMKKHISVLTPGSIFKIAEAYESSLDEWYFKLLNTILKY